MSQATRTRTAIDRIRKAIFDNTDGLAKDSLIEVYETISCDMDGMIEACRQEMADKARRKRDDEENRRC